MAWVWPLAGQEGGGVGHYQINFSTVICYIPMQPLPLADLLTVDFLPNTQGNIWLVRLLRDSGS